MITNLFTTFDPSSSNLLSLNWLSLLLPIIFTPFSFWVIPAKRNLTINFIFHYIKNETKNNINPHNLKIIWIFVTLFWFILINNLLGLYPYIFTATSHLILTLTIALPCWLLFIIFGWFSKINYIFTHLVPIGTPFLLASFIVLIETIRNIIRPITLSVRLTANIIAGHLLLTLLRNISEKIPFIYIFSYPILVALLLLEYAVAIIQSYVFITLLSLYITEIN